MSAGLFRDEVLRARREAWLGTVSLPVPRRGWLLAALGGAALLVIAATLAFGSLHRTVRASGTLQPAEGLQRVQAPEAGVVVRVHVTDGAIVAAGDPLLDIAVDRDLADGGAPLSARVAESLEAERTRLRAALQTFDVAQPAREADLQARLATLVDEAGSARDEIALRERQAANADDVFARLQPLREARIVSEVQVQQYENQALEARAALGAARRAGLEAERRLADGRRSLREQALSQANERGTLAQALADLDRGDAENRARGTIRLRAQRPGVVSTSGLSTGSPVAAGEPLLTIVPNDARFVAELWVPAQAVAHLAPGQRVKMRYDAFPHRRYGQQPGEVISVARAAQSAPPHARTGADASVPLYRVLVRPDHQNVPGADAALRTDIGVDADLILERQRLYQRLFGDRFARPTVARAD
ncbi:HlyD family efflux transporter periplasmic adaptor subunit [Luteimonas sp. TWI1437]|uniref:HlyD family secretion protein n=1 Tax=unclassified Luteimonas TaxID=2629088 RepID=UPI00320ABA8E